MGKPTFLGPAIGKGAGQCELINTDGNAVLAAHVEPAFDSKSRKRGLLGRDAVPEDYALVIAPCGGIHTFSMRFPIDAVFVSRDGTVIKTCRDVKPWRIAVAWRAFAVIEAAAGFIARTETVPGDVVALREVPHTRRVTDAPSPVAVPPPADAGSGKPHRTDRPKRISLADVVSRQTPLAWFESVAIVQELCEAVLTRGPADDPRVPELKHIALTPEGGVELLGGGPADHSPVQRASLVLLALTPETQLPVQLRLLALEEVLPTPRLGSLKDLHTELEFFERPDRRDVVRGVYERMRNASASAAADGVVPAPLLEPPAPKRRHRWWKRPRVWAGLAIVLLAAGAASYVQWAWPRQDGQWMRSAVSTAAATTTTAVQAAVRVAREQVGAVQRKLGISRRHAAPEPLPRADLGAATPPSAPIRTAPAEPSAPVPPILPRGVAAELQAAGSSQHAVATPPPPDAPAPDAQRVPTPEVVYSSADPLVVPPVLVRPAMPKPPPPGARLNDVADVELVVSTTGEVEAVKLLAAGQGPRPVMMLSAVKTWRFQPATRGGQPVPYRLRLRLPIR